MSTSAAPRCCCGPACPACASFQRECAQRAVRNPATATEQITSVKKSCLPKNRLTLASTLQTHRANHNHSNKTPVSTVAAVCCGTCTSCALDRRRLVQQLRLCITLSASTTALRLHGLPYPKAESRILALYPPARVRRSGRPGGGPASPDAPPGRRRWPPAAGCGRRRPSGQLHARRPLQRLHSGAPSSEPPVPASGPASHMRGAWLGTIRTWWMAGYRVEIVGKSL